MAWCYDATQRISLVAPDWNFRSRSRVWCNSFEDNGATVKKIRKTLSRCPACKSRDLSFIYSDDRSWEHCTEEKATCHKCGYEWIQPHKKLGIMANNPPVALFSFATKIDVGIGFESQVLKAYNMCVLGKIPVEDHECTKELQQAHHMLHMTHRLPVTINVMSDGSFRLAGVGDPPARTIEKILKVNKAKNLVRPLSKEND